ncbi:von Willebrand factor type A domain-containing protein [Talaromyces proteolyticus]|uniref:von Willebrand factor type A domain-containing protein n=1 Tax=Talaromyces proteolyticus TaxID=1131652 RepID=A0AAD4KD78_9EURO|nr:von Willebrand factor type A domain-containing protein [Talaromyces proteolyticus]KAH8688884.1 von Willebrand factor type A domain-containing protein [Talaromyces proteolyticus]
MDVLDRLQSGLFFHQPSITDSGLSINHPTPLWAQTVSNVDYNYVQPPDTHHAPSPTHAPSHTRLIPLPLLSVSVDVDMHGRLCTTKVTQQFSNTSSSTAQNAKYVFPTYDGSVVTTFRCWIGNDRLLEGAVKAKEEAQADFQHAVSQHKVAVLVEELAPEVLETNVGNIPGQTTVKIEIIYTNLLKVDNSSGGLVFTIPTSIAPRYGVAPDGYSVNQSLLTEGLRVKVQASMPAVIRKIESPSHPISVEIGAVPHHSFENFAAGASSETFDFSKGRATLAGRSTALDRDFVLHILCSSRELTKSQALAATQPDQPSLSTVAVTIHPGDLFLQNVDMEDFDGEIIFMADRSGSMHSKIHSLINVMNIFLRSLPQKCSFNIASFGSSFAWLWPASEKYNQENLDIASQHVGSFEANFGGTEIYLALQSVLDHYNKRSDVVTSVILLTDGEVWDVDNVIQLVRRAVSRSGSNIRFFSIGIGDRVSHRLVEGIGQQGGGYAEVVHESLMGSWQERVIQMLKAALTPSHLQCEVDLGQEFTTRSSERQISGYTVHCPAMIKAPHHIPVLNTFSYFTLYYMLESELESLPATVTVSVTTDKGERLTAQLPLRKVTDQIAIHHLAAKALMNDYETGQSWLDTLNSNLKSTNPAAFDKILEQQAQHLGQKWSITGKWTSYVAIDRTSAQHHEISVRKVNTIDISQLTRPRYTSSFSPWLPIESPSVMATQATATYPPTQSNIDRVLRGPTKTGNLRNYVQGVQTPHCTSARSNNCWNTIQSLQSSAPPTLSAQQFYDARNIKHPAKIAAAVENANTAATPTPITPQHTPQHPPQHPNSFNKNVPTDSMKTTQQQPTPVLVHSIVPQQPDPSPSNFDDFSMPGPSGFNFDFGALENPDIQDFDFDSFLNTDGDTTGFRSDPSISYSADDVEKGSGIPPFDSNDGSQSQNNIQQECTSRPLQLPPQSTQPERDQEYGRTRHFVERSNDLATGSIPPTDYCGQHASQQSYHLGRYASLPEPARRTNGRPPQSISSAAYEEDYHQITDQSPCATQAASLRAIKDSSEQPIEETQPYIQAKEILSLEKILFTQGADGKFHLDGVVLSDALSQQCGTTVLELFLDSIFEDNVSTQRGTDFRFLHLNILAVIYITVQHAASKDLWELQVAKARQWIKQKMTELLKDKGDLEKPQEISLEELERSIIKELHGNDL